MVFGGFVMLALVAGVVYLVIRQYQTDHPEK